MAAVMVAVMVAVAVASMNWHQRTSEGGKIHGLLVHEADSGCDLLSTQESQRSQFQRWLQTAA